MQLAPADIQPRMSGFPPSDETLVSLASWQDSRNVRWAFQHMRELMPTQAIPADPARVRPLAVRPQPRVLDAEVHRLDGSTTTAAEVFGDTYTDAVYFSSEEEARANENKPMPPEAQQMMDDMESAIEITEFLDLRRLTPR